MQLYSSQISLQPPQTKSLKHPTLSCFLPQGTPICKITHKSLLCSLQFLLSLTTFVRTEKTRERRKPTLSERCFHMHNGILAFKARSGTIQDFSHKPISFPSFPYRTPCKSHVENFTGQMHSPYLKAIPGQAAPVCHFQPPPCMLPERWSVGEGLNL